MLRPLAILLTLAAPLVAEPVSIDQSEVVRARLTDPTDRYDHRVLGDQPLWGGLEITVNSCIGCARPRLVDLKLALPQDRVFEDIEARIVDLDGDGLAEVLVVETEIARGATLAVYDARGRRAATKPVGQTHRWLAPAGVGDFDGDGRIEIAYVDRPHLARELVFVRLEGDTLRELARVKGLTNHRIGDTFISGGSRNCGAGDEVIVASADWTRIVAVTLGGARDLGGYSPARMARVMRCQ